MVETVRMSDRSVCFIGKGVRILPIYACESACQEILKHFRVIVTPCVSAPADSAHRTSRTLYGSESIFCAVPATYGSTREKRKATRHGTSVRTWIDRKSV